MQLSARFIVVKTWVMIFFYNNNYIEKLSKEGTSSNLSSEVVEAISYSLAKEMKVDDFYVQNSKDYKPPQYVAKLPPRESLNGGEAVTVEEVIKKFSIFLLKS